ncbi:L,D-transpeptidase, partial [Aeromonas diversa]
SNQWLIINKSTNKLAFFENGKLVKEFNVATGRSPSYTPEGTFNIVNKIKNRPYYSKNIPGGSPKNPLGDRWFGIEARGTY